MQKIPTLFLRDFVYNPQLVTQEINPEAAWVLEDMMAIPTRQFDGTACLIKNGRLYKHYDAKAGRVPPVPFEPAQPSPDAITGHWPGWLPVGDESEDQYYREALEWDRKAHGFNNYLSLPSWTYELLGPKVQGNAEHYSYHVLKPHGDETLRGVALLARRGFLTFEFLKDYLATEAIEGIVWWKNLDDMNAPKVKLKRSDFGLPWPIKEKS